MLILIINMTDGCDRDESFFTSSDVRININKIYYHIETRVVFINKINIYYVSLLTRDLRPFYLIFYTLFVNFIDLLYNIILSFFLFVLQAASLNGKC